MTTPVHIPYHDPEMVEIIEETLALREAADMKDRERQQRFETLKREQTARKQALPTSMSLPPAVSHTSTMQTPTAEITPTAQSIDTVKSQEEILDKNTHYVFIFGYTGSGKSTVLTALNMYMRQHYRVILNHAGNQGGIRLMHQMMRDVEHGRFPQPTSIGQITEYDTAFLMNGEDVNLTFLEMAGEDLKRVDVDTGEEGLPDSVKAYLNCPGISISFLLVADYERVVARKEDKLILQFLSFLYNEGIDLSRVGVVLSKFDRGRTDMDVESVVRTHLPQVDKWLTSGDIAQPRVFPFSIGDIQQFPDRKDEIQAIDLEDCGEIVPWLHHVLSLPGGEASQGESAASHGILNRLKGMLNW